MCMHHIVYKILRKLKKMLTLIQKQYMEGFLQGLPIHSVLSVAHTVSKGMLEPQDKAAAIKIIVQHSESVESILARKFVSKQYLFSYLHWRNVSVPQSSTKPDLIKKILVLWEDPSASNETFVHQKSQGPSTDHKAFNYYQEQDSQDCPDDESNSFSNSSLINSNNDVTLYDSCDQSLGRESCSSNSNSYPSIRFNNSSRESHSNESTVSSSVMNSSSLINKSNDNNMNSCHMSSDFNADELAIKFSEWFYGLVNKTNHVISDSPDSLGPQHFWQDVAIKISLFSNNEQSIHEASGAMEVTELILSIKTQHNLYFCPNLSYEGVRGKSEPHGMVLILACGTLHKGVGQFIGVFEQIFHLLRDPLCSYNWKVKHSQLILKAKIVAAIEEIPTLNNSALAHSYLQMQALE